MSKLLLEIKEKALNLRTKGYSIKEIADILNIAKSTSSLWVRNINLNEKAIERLKKRRLLGYYNATLKWREKRIKEENKYRLSAKGIIKKIKKNDNYAKLYCALLYWCEGGKRDEVGMRFINSDPSLVKTFLDLLRKSFVIDEKKLHILMHLHKYHNEDKQKNFWSEITGISKTQFYKTFHKPNTEKRIKNNYPGCAVIYYNNCRVARELKAIYKEFANI